MERFILNPIPASEVEVFKKQLSWEDTHEQLIRANCCKTKM
jgi:hypothetical protein